MATAVPGATGNAAPIAGSMVATPEPAGSDASTVHPDIFRHITAAQGLPDNQIEGLFIAPDNRLGIISPSLLTLFDGIDYAKFPYSSHNAYRWARGFLPIATYVDAQHRVWLKKSTSLHVFDLIRERFIANTDSLLASMGVTEPLANLFISDNGNIWFVTERGRLLLWRDAEAKEVRIPYDGHATHTIIGVGTASDRDILVTSQGELFFYDVANGEFRRKETGLQNSISPEDRVVIAPAKDNDFWVMWDDGVAYYDYLQSNWIVPSGLTTLPSDIFTSLSTDASGNAWVGTGLSGIFFIPGKTKQAVHYPAVPMVSGEQVVNDITNIAVNRHTDDVWLAFIFRGIAYGHPTHNVFHHLGASFGASQCRSLAIMPDGTVMLGTLQGLKRCSGADGMEATSAVAGLENEKCRSLMVDSAGDLWVGTIFNGLFRVSGGKVARHYFDPGLTYHVFGTDADYNSILAMCQDSRGRYWVSVRGGICSFNPATGRFTLMREKFPELARYTTCHSIADDGNGNLVVGSTTGMFILDPDNGLILETYKYPEFAVCDVYNTVLRDSRGLLWLGTQNGIQVVDPELHCTYHISSFDGLGNSVVKALIEDKIRNIWVATSNGLNRVEVSHDAEGYHFDVRPYSASEGLQAGEYYAGSGARAADGTVYFGGLDGLTFFNPDKFVFNNNQNRPLITALMIGNRYVRPGQEFDGNIILDKSLAKTSHITLDHNQNYLTLLFSGLNFANPEQTSYRYRLRGLDDGWTESSFTNRPGRVTYTNLKPGTYVFEVLTANNDKVWSALPTELKITIRPPFWATIWAKIIYAVLAVLLLWGLWLLYQRKSREKIERIRLAEAQKQKEELDQMKFKFFTNISHEFRTPLTLIITPLQSFIRKMQEGDDKERLKSIQRNANQLLDLVNQLLDFRKVEMKASTLKLKSGNIRELVITTVDSFAETAAEKGIGLGVETDALTNPSMALDSGKIHKILNNLLSNALKYTNSGGNVTVSLANVEVQGRPCVSISVSDTGIGIPAADVAHVFDRFFQASNNHTEGKGSSGVGLHLIKELTQVHKGTVEVVSTEGQGTTFTVTLPADLHTDLHTEDAASADIAPKDATSGQEAEETASAADAKPLVLIVEDNEEFRHYMCGELAANYRVLDAPDGQAGLQLAIERNPDVIISDVMMPIMDGIHMCQNIKQNVQTSHIPVVLLTARASNESRTEGYEAGADAYLTKPFDIDALLARIRQLIAQKQQRQATFRKEITVEPSRITITSVDEQLVQKALECVEKNMDNSEYSVDELCADLAMTRATLYRKMQGITGQTPKDFIRTIRIKRATQLLGETTLSVSEIGYMTGFSSPRIFSRNFKEVMGVLPSQYAGRDEK